MIDHSVLIEIAEIFLISSIAGLILSKFKQPAIVAYILTGIIIGPSGFALVQNQELINQLAEIGVMALLFTLGLEFSFDQLKQVSKKVLVAGSAQIILTIAFVSLITTFLGLNTAQSLLIGGIVALSSTVIVLKTMTECAQIDSIHGKIILGILIIQDLSLIPIMIILPNLGSDLSTMALPLVFALVKAALFITFVLFLSLKLAPIIMNFIASTNKEMLILSSIAIAVGTALVANSFGISLALGAFIAGLALSVTAHSKQVITEIIPFRDAFAMVFFVSIGLLMDLNFFAENVLLILAIVTGIFALKFLICFTATYMMKYPGQTALWTGLSLFQIGEFSFVLAKLGESKGIITSDFYSLIMISALLTMLMTPFIIRNIPNLVLKLQKEPIWVKHFRGGVEIDKTEKRLSEHTVICGCGPIGNGVAKILKLHCEKFIVVELNNKAIKKLKKEHTPAIYGDATHIDILTHAGVERAKIIVVALPDVRSNELVVLNARKLNANIFIIARARYQSHIDKLYQAGANTVVYEEYETSMAIIDNTLNKLGYSCSEIDAITNVVRANKCQLLKESYKNADSESGRMSIFLNNEVEWIKIPDNNALIGQTLSESNIRQLTGVSIMAIIRGQQNIPNPSPNMIVEKSDVLVTLGTTQQLNKLKEILD